MELLPFLGLLGLLLAKEAGVPIPVPGDLLVIGAGARGVAVARATPGVRIGAIAASGLAALPYPAFLGGLVLGNTVFVGAHFALGYVLGPPALDLLARAGGIGLAIAGLALLSGAGALGWRWLRLRQPRSPHATGHATGGDAVSGSTSDIPGAGAWLEASCPACIAVSVIRAGRTASGG